MAGARPGRHDEPLHVEPEQACWAAYFLESRGVSSTYTERRDYEYDLQKSTLLKIAGQPETWLVAADLVRTEQHKPDGWGWEIRKGNLAMDMTALSLEDALSVWQARERLISPRSPVSVSEQR